MRMSALIALLLLPVLAAAGGHLVLEPSGLDFGTMTRHETHEATVTLRNDGDAPLSIQRVEATCGCTVPELAVDQLAPGQSTTMDVQFNSQDFQGRQLKFIKIYTDVVSQRVIDFPVKAMITVPLEMHPPSAMVRFPAVHGGETRTISYTFMAQAVSPLEIKPVTWPEAWLDVAVRPGTDPQTVNVDFTVKADGPSGSHREALKLRTNVPEVPVVNLEADARILSDLTARPERVNLRRVRAGQDVAIEVEVTAAAPGTAFKLTGAEVDIPGLAAEVENGETAVVRLAGQALAFDHPFAAERKGRIAGTLTIRTDHASSPVLELPVTYMLRR